MNGCFNPVAGEKFPVNVVVEVDHVPNVAVHESKREHPGRESLVVEVMFGSCLFGLAMKR